MMVNQVYAVAIYNRSIGPLIQSIPTFAGLTKSRNYKRHSEPNSHLFSLLGSSRFQFRLLLFEFPFRFLVKSVVFRDLLYYILCLGNLSFLLLSILTIR